MVGVVRREDKSACNRTVWPPARDFGSWPGEPDALHRALFVSV